MVLVMTEIRPPDPGESVAPPAEVRAVPLSYEGAFDALYARAYAVAFQLCGRRPEAEDAAQEALARAFLRWDDVQDYAEAWVVRVASNATIGSWRKSRHTISLAVADLGDGPSAIGPNGDRVDLLRALRHLPRRQREVVTLRYVADLPEAEVARALDCSTGTVKQHASRGLAALRTAFGAEITLPEVF
jgi:RNA polymerase sigma factor (sigma-70 family)